MPWSWVVVVVVVVVVKCWWRFPTGCNIIFKKILFHTDFHIDTQGNTKYRLPLFCCCPPPFSYTPNWFCGSRSAIQLITLLVPTGQCIPHITTWSQIELHFIICREGGHASRIQSPLYTYLQQRYRRMYGLPGETNKFNFSIRLLLVSRSKYFWAQLHLIYPVKP